VELQKPSTVLRDPSISDTQFNDRRPQAHMQSAVDQAFSAVSRTGGIITVGIMVAVGLFLTLRAQTAFRARGIHFLTETAWMPESGKYGIAAVLFGTVSIAVIAMCVSVPLALGTALLIAEVLPERFRGPAVTLVDLMAAVPQSFLVCGACSFSRPTSFPFPCGCPTSLDSFPSWRSLTVLVIASPTQVRSHRLL